MLVNFPAVHWMADGGTGTGSASPGTSTDDDTSGSATHAGSGARFTEDQVAGMKGALQRKFEKELAGAGKKAIGGLLEELGLDSVDDLREVIVAKQEQASDAEKANVELKKLQRQLAKLTSERDEAVKGLSELRDANNRAKIKEAVYSAASKIKAYEEDVYNDLIVSGLVGIDDDGSVIVRGPDGDPANTTLDKLIQTRIAAKPHLQRPTPHEGGGSLPANTAATVAPSAASDDGFRRALLSSGIGSDWTR